MATDKAYARKLEAKLSASRNISDLHARCSQYKLKLREMAQELEEAESRTASAQELADLRSTEVSTDCTTCCVVYNKPDNSNNSNDNDECQISTDSHNSASVFVMRVSTVITYFKLVCHSRARCM